MTVDEMKAELGRLNAEIVTLKKQVVKIQQLITTNPNYKFVVRSCEFESNLQQTLDDVIEMSDKSDPKKTQAWIGTFQLFKNHIKTYGYRYHRAAQDIAACEAVLQELKTELSSKETERRGLYLALAACGVKKSPSTVVFQNMSDKPAMPSPAPIVQKTPDEIFDGFARYQKDVGGFLGSPLLLPKVLHVKRLGQPTPEEAEVLRSRLTPGGQP